MGRAREHLIARADEAAAHFVSTLGASGSERDTQLVHNAYAVGWIQGAYAGANEAKPDVCRRRTRRKPPTCTYNQRG